MEKSTQKIIIYQSELDYLSQCILDCPNIETGGNLFGFWTPFGIPVVHYVLGPGPQAVHDVMHFRQDFDFLESHADQLVATHALHHIGSWHSHHSMGLTQPSQGDALSTLEGMRECGLSSFLLLIGNCRAGKSSVQAYRYHSDGMSEPLRWVVLPGTSPIRMAYESLHGNRVYVPKSLPNMLDIPTCSLIESTAPIDAKITYPEGYWLNQVENKQHFVAIVGTLREKYDDVRIFQKRDKTIAVEVSNGHSEIEIYFSVDFPQTMPAVHPMNGKCITINKDYRWHADNIVESFVELINSIRYDA